MLLGPMQSPSDLHGRVQAEGDWSADVFVGWGFARSPRRRVCGLQKKREWFAVVPGLVPPKGLSHWSIRPPPSIKPIGRFVQLDRHGWGLRLLDILLHTTRWRCGHATASTLHPSSVHADGSEGSRIDPQLRSKKMTMIKTDFICY